jgi:FtsP/CotA-like multicopper oxidase with cupredoxin domain
MVLQRLLALASILSIASSVLAAPHLQTRAAAPPVKFTIDLTWDDWSPTGAAPRKAILTNGTIPGPPLRLKQGDNVEFLVYNNLPNVTSIHFHGITQKNTPWSDGVPGVSQAPIQPGESYLYKWQADEAGVYFYHAHYQSQIMDGLYGSIVIQPQDSAKRPWSFISNDVAVQKSLTAADKALQPVFISDYSQYTSSEFHQIEKAGNIDNACADAILINGLGSTHCLTRDELTAYTAPPLKPLLAAVNPPQLTAKGCLPPNLPATQGNFTFDISAVPSGAYEQCTPSSGQMPQITVDPKKNGGWTALTFINTGGFQGLKFTIDNHKMWVYAVDGHYVTPQLVDVIVANNGDRYSVMIHLDQNPGQYTIRVANNGLNQVISGFGVLGYKGATWPASEDPDALSKMNYAGVNLTHLVPFVDAKASPFPPVKVGQKADQTFTFNVEKLGRPFGAYEWTLDGTQAFNMTREDGHPLLFDQPTSVPKSDLILRTKTGQWVDLIVKVAGPLAQPHPMHKHSNKAFVLGQGVGNFSWSSVAEAAKVVPKGTFNFVDPPCKSPPSKSPPIPTSQHQSKTTTC